MLYKLLRHKSAFTGLILIFAFAVVAIFAPYLTPHDPFEQRLLSRLAPPSWDHICGTDGHGRDILSRIIMGSRISLMIGALSVIIGVGIGSMLGLIAGYAGGYIDDIIMRAMDIMISFPGVLLALVVVAILGPGLFNVVLAIGVWSIPVFARLVRSEALAIKEEDYVTAARAIGCNDVVIILRHVLRNCFAPILVLITLRFATSILSAASLSFLGLGAQPPTPDWGTMLSDGKDYLSNAWWVATCPGIAIMLIVLGFNLLGDSLRDVLDPKMTRIG